MGMREQRSATCLGITLAMMAVFTIGAGASSFHSDLAQGNARLRAGDVEGAMAVFRELQVEYPDSELIHYGIGCAHLEAAEQLLERNAVSDAMEAFELARAAFSRAQTGSDAAVRRNAAYNEANAMARQALELGHMGAQDIVIEAFEQAINQYEDVLRRYPDHEDAQHNLDHMRYQLKRMLQEPPPPPEDQEDGQPEESEEETPSDDDDDEGEGPPPETDQEEQDEQDGPSPDDPDGTADDDEDDATNDGAEPFDDWDAPEDEAPDPLEWDEAEEEEPPSPDRQAIEAILESLMEMDEREQQRMRRGTPDERFPREWW